MANLNDIKQTYAIAAEEWKTAAVRDMGEAGMDSADTAIAALDAANYLQASREVLDLSRIEGSLGTMVWTRFCHEVMAFCREIRNAK